MNIDSTKKHVHCASCGHEHENSGVWRLYLSGGLYAAGFLLGGFSGFFPAPSGALSLGFMFLFYAIPYALCGFNVLKEAAASLVRGDFFNEFTLMASATLAAVALGEYPEAVGVMFFYSVGEHFQDLAAGRSRRSIEALLASKPTVAHLVQGEQVTDADPADIEIGSLLLVKGGEKIPLDGVVTRGISSVDMSPLTGESLPETVKEGSKVLGGTINLDGAIYVKTTARYENSSVARIMEMIENAVGQKAQTERFITRFARYYTPAVVFIALLVAFIPPVFYGLDLRTWIYRALVLLVISCPCALVISIPLGYFGGIGAASRRGILVKGGNVLDALKGIKVVAFDKTGTLTKGVFEVTNILPVGCVTEKDLMKAALTAEINSLHPIARSIKSAALFMGVLPQTVLSTKEYPGRGIAAQTSEGSILAGNIDFLSEFLPEFSSQNIDEPDIPGSAVYVSENGRYLGVLGVSDVLRDDAKSAIARLRALGVEKIIMLTGDRAKGAAWVAEELGLDDFRASLLPQDKAAALTVLGATKECVFVGDGINDAPVLAVAGVGVAMGGLGSEAAIEISDAVVLDDSPQKVADLISIAAKTRRIVWENIILSMGVKGIFMILGISGISGLWEAVFADVGVAILAVLNAGRAVRIK